MYSLTPQQNPSEILKRLQLVSKYVLLLTPPLINEAKRIRQITSVYLLAY